VFTALADRFASAAEFCSALGASATVNTVSGARRVAVPSRTARMLRVVPWAVAALLAAVLVWQPGAPSTSSATSRQQVTLWKYPVASPLDAGATRLGNQAARTQPPRWSTSSIGSRNCWPSPGSSGHQCRCSLNFLAVSGCRIGGPLPPHGNRKGGRLLKTIRRRRRCSLHGLSAFAQEVAR